MPIGPIKLVLPYSRWPGQVPLRSRLDQTPGMGKEMKELTGAPKEFRPQMLFEQNDPRPTPASVLRDLGFDPATHTEWVRFLVDWAPKDEATFRQALWQKLQESDFDTALTKVLSQRCLVHYRSVMDKSIQVLSAEDVDVLMKAKALPVGSIRTWKDGKKYRKNAKGDWVQMQDTRQLGLLLGDAPKPKKAKKPATKPKKKAKKKAKKKEAPPAPKVQHDHDHEAKAAHKPEPKLVIPEDASIRASHEDLMGQTAAHLEALGVNPQQAYTEAAREKVEEAPDQLDERYAQFSQEDMLREMGDYLDMIDDVREFNNVGFDKISKKIWGPHLSVDGMHRILHKFRNTQLKPHFGEAAIKLAGLDVRPEPKKGPQMSVTVEGDKVLLGKPTSWVSNFNKFRSINAEFGVKWTRRTGNYIPLEAAREVNWGAYQVEMSEELGITVDDLPELPDAEQAKAQADKDRAEAKARQDEMSADDVAHAIARREISDRFAVRVMDDGGIRINTPYASDISTFFSNRGGQISGIMEAHPEDNWARSTYSVELMEEIVDKLKDKYGWDATLDPKFVQMSQEKDRIKAEQEAPIKEVQEKLAPGIKLFPYQNAMVRFLDKTDGNAIVGDEMGLGKTLQSLAWAAKNNKKVLVVVPKVVRRTWLEEAEKFFPGHFKSKELIPADIAKAKKKHKPWGPEEVELAPSTDPDVESFFDFLTTDHETGEKRQLKVPREKSEAEKLAEQGLPDLSGVNLASVNYESLEKFMPAIKAAGFDTIIVDESHRVKNPKAKITQTIGKLAKEMKHRILMSGTAVKNKKDELYTQSEMVKPGLFASKQSLKMATIGGTWHKMRDIYLARTKREVLTDMPEKTTTIARLPQLLPPTLAQEMEEAEARGEEFRLTIDIISKIKAEQAQSKVPHTIDFVNDIMTGSDSKVLVFTDSVEAAKKIKDKLGDKALLHHGQMSDDKREAAKKEFQREGSKPRVFVSTRQSLAVGATLTAADKVVFNDLPWTAADVRQAEDRAHRVGQKNNVNVTWMTADNPFDSLISDIVMRKYKLSKMVNEGKQVPAEDQEWMEKPLSIKDIQAALKGEKVGPDLDKSMYRRFEADMMYKAQARGGSYHRRVPKPGGGYTYIYNEDDYHEREDAHLSGPETRQKRAREAIVSRASEGCSIKDLESLVPKYGKDLVKESVKWCVKQKQVSYKKGKLSVQKTSEASENAQGTGKDQKGRKALESRKKASSRPRKS